MLPESNRLSYNSAGWIIPIYNGQKAFIDTIMSDFNQ